LIVSVVQQQFAVKLKSVNQPRVSYGDLLLVAGVAGDLCFSS